MCGGELLSHIQDTDPLVLHSRRTHRRSEDAQKKKMVQQDVRVLLVALCLHLGAAAAGTQDGVG